MKKAVGFGDDVVTYTLRHTCLTKLAEDADGLLIQKWAGHKSIATTQRYVKATKRGMDALAKLLE
jgi:integrase